MIKYLFLLLFIFGCYNTQYVICPVNLEKCLERQLPKGSKVIKIDSTTSDRHIYIVRYYKHSLIL